MSDSEDKELKNSVHTDKDDDFDYLKEIEAIEAQEKELEAQRQKKKAELEKLREEREKEERRNASQKKREMKEKKKEAEWLGETFSDGVETVEVPKKKSKKGLIAAIVVILIIIAVGSVYAYKLQMDKKTVAEFEQKVASFQSEKMDGVSFGAHAEYFDDFMKQCQEAIEAGDLSAIAELNKKWSEIEETFTTVSNGKTSLDAFVAGADETLASYSITDDYKDEYDALKADIEKAQKDCDYDQIGDLQKRIDALATNLKADNMKVVQNIKNEIASVDLDEDYTTDEQKDKLAKYNEQVEKAVSDGDYASAIQTLNSWKADAVNISNTITARKEEEAAKAAAEAEARRKAESEAAAKAAAESKAKAESNAKATETKKETQKPSSGGSSSSGNSSVSGDYVLPGSSSKYLSASDVKNLSSYQLMIARNEIYARHGRKFNDKELQAYFNGKSWYHGTVEPDDFSVSVFNDYEIKNIELIRSYE